MCAMPRMRIVVRFVVVLTALCAVGMARAQSSNAPTATLSGKLRAQRSSPADLELSGDLAGVPRGESRFLTREDLLAVSQAITISPDDGNFKASAPVTAVSLEALTHALGVPPNDLVIAICKDKYRGHYPLAYRSAHRPVLVIEFNGKPLPGSPETGADDPGPYLIAHANFKPAFKVLGATDEPQIPWGVVRLEFRDEESVFGAIAPRGTHAGDEAVQNGFKIAQQNCFRCHNNGTEGGMKSVLTWTVLGAMAANSPDFFTEYVRDPRAKNPKTQMAGSPTYDDATMQALIAYFRTFVPTEAH